MYDPNESSAVYLLTSDDKYAVCGMDFSPESTSLPKIFSGGLSITCRATKKINFHRYAAMGLGDLRHRSTMILKVKVYINGHESGGKPWRGTQQLVNEFHQLDAKNLNVNAVQRSICQRNLIFHIKQKKKKIIVFII